MNVRRRWLSLAIALAAAVLFLSRPPEADAFCGFYVGKADAELFNEASQVVIARHDGKTVLSMMNDYEGPLEEFALVVPVPVILKEKQIHIGDPKLFERIDAFTAPRLVEYYDPDPCEVRLMRREMMALDAPQVASGAARAKALGVTVEATYTIGEYDIVILSAEQSDGLETWLLENGYRIPRGARKALQPYIKQDMKFFVARVNLEEQAKTGLTHLRPIQFAFEDERFMLPIRLGMVNARGPQDLIVFVLTRDGRVETTNYPTVKLPTGMDVPLFVKNEFGDFYRDMFATQVGRENMRAVFTEYFWNMGWCDPCAADPLSRDELRQLGVFWLDGESDPTAVQILPGPRPRPIPGALPVMVTRLHVRYAHDTFPEDLVFQKTKDQQNFQARYVLRHPWKGDTSKCEAARSYFRDVRERQEKEAQTLANLTGWDISEIREKIDFLPAPRPEPTPGPTPTWWERLWD